MNRAVGLDLGSVRIGVALSDTGRIIASPHSVLARGVDHGSDHAAIAALVDEAEAGVVVVGLPRSLDGRDGPAARAVRGEVAELAARVGVPVVTWDERLSTVTANRSLIAGGVRRRNRKSVVDKVAAAVILQSWLDAHSSGSAEGESPPPPGSTR